MRFPGLLWAAAAAAGLLAAGCDYWRNLLDDHEVSHASFKVQVVDAWTRTPLPNSRCIDPRHGMDGSTDDSGMIRLPEAGTGVYTLVCTAEGYRPSARKKDLGQAGDTVIVEMARDSGANWYPGEPDRQVMIGGPADSFRFPGFYHIDAFPRDDAGRFRYEWTFKQNTKLGRSIKNPLAADDRLILDIDAKKAEPGTDTVILRVWSHLAGQDWYEVGADTLEVCLERNRLPFFVDGGLAFNKPSAYKVCKNNQDPVYLNFRAADPDGHCDSIAVESRDPLSVMGKFRMSKPFCKEGYFALVPKGLRNDNIRSDSAIESTDSLLVSLWDDNREHFDTTIALKTISNALPRIRIAKPERTTFLQYSEVKATVEVTDEFGPLKAVRIKWGDGDPEEPIPESELASPSPSYSLTHPYLDTGPHLIQAFATDYCDEEGADSTGITVNIRPNTAPQITFYPVGYHNVGDSLPYEIRVLANDRDVGLGIDFLRIEIDWGDDSPIQFDSTARENGTGRPLLYDRHLWHVYRNPPASGKTYPLNILVIDATSGRDEYNFEVPVRPGLQATVP